MASCSRSIAGVGLRVRRWPLPFVLGLLLATIISTTVVEARVVEVEFNVTHGFAALDGVERVVTMVNGQIPGPAIYCDAYDRVRIIVRNMLCQEEAFTLHVHGLWMRGTPYMDGTSGGTQCSIEAGETFVYDFAVADQVGTYWWHGHADSMSRNDGIFGAFIVRDPQSPLKYDEERLLVLSDWYHQDGRTLTAGISQQHFRWVGDPQSILHNGKGNFSCASFAASSYLKCTPQTPSQALASIQVEAGKTYLLRVVSTTTMSFLDLAIEGHDLTVVEADGNYVSPFTTSHLPINSGERYAVLLTANQGSSTGDSSSYWIATETRFRTVVKGYAVLQYTSTTTAAAAGGELTSRPTHEPPAHHPGSWSPEVLALEAAYLAMMKNGTAPAVWGAVRDRTFKLWAEASLTWLRQVVASSDTVRVHPVENTRHRQISIVETQCRMSTDGSFENYTPYSPSTQTYTNQKSTDGNLRWCLNNHTFHKPSSPILLDTWFNTLDEEKQNPLIMELRDSEVVDVLIQNARGLNDVSEQHPWHIHGHGFWVLGYGMGVYDASRDASSLNLVNPPYRDMITTFPFGWAIVRFKADNPGVWPLHCHIESHALMGMHVYFIEAKEKIPAPPEGFKLCGTHAPYLSGSRTVPQGADITTRGSTLDSEDGSEVRSVITALVVLLVFSVLVNLTVWVKSEAFSSFVRLLLAMRMRESSSIKQPAGIDETAAAREQEEFSGTDRNVPVDSEQIEFRDV